MRCAPGSRRHPQRMAAAATAARAQPVLGVTGWCSWLWRARAGATWARGGCCGSWKGGRLAWRGSTWMQLSRCVGWQLPNVWGAWLAGLHLPQAPPALSCTHHAPCVSLGALRRCPNVAMHRTILMQVIEIGQVGRAVAPGGGVHLFAHTQRGQPWGDTDALLEALTQAADGVPATAGASGPVTLARASDSTPGIPPSSLMSLLRVKPSTSGEGEGGVAASAVVWGSRGSWHEAEA